MRKLIKKLQNYYAYNLKMHTKFIVSHLVLVLVPTLVLGITFYGQLYELIVSKTIQSEQAISEQSVALIDTTLEQVITTSHSITDSSFFTELFQSVTKSTTPEDTHSEQAKTFIDMVNSQPNSNITSIKIYVDEPHAALYESSATAGVFRPISEAYGTHWYGIFSSSSIAELFCPSFYLSPTETVRDGGLAYIEKINYGSSRNTAAYCAVYFSQQNLDSILVQNVPFLNSATYVINDRDALVTASDSALSGVYRLPYDDILDATKSPRNYITKSIQGTDFYMGYYEIPSAKWILVSVLPTQPIVQKGNQLAFIFIVIYLLVLALAFFIALALSRSISRRISTVATQMDSVRNHPGSPPKIEGPQGTDEIGKLVGTYNYMSDEIESLLQKQAQSAKDMRTAEFQALQAQINPHFLYNSLDMINWLAKNGQTGDVAEAVQALSKFYKLTLSKNDAMTSVSQEIEHASLYVQLQNMRYQNKIHFFVDIPDDLLLLRIPNLLFQPIVENSIQHGIFERPEKEGNIVITGWLEDETIIFLLSDNGVGMSSEQVANILSGEKPADDAKIKKGSNIGVYNTHRRLQLLYGPQYGLSFSSKEGVGTDVEMRIPYMSL